MSMNYRKTKKPGLMHPAVDKDGYLTIILSKNGQHKTYKVHRLVAETFIPNPNNLPQINHINEDKKNNTVNNLEWCDNKYNNNFGTKKYAKTKQIDQYTLEGILIRTFYGAREAGRQLEVNHSHIVQCANGERNRAYGFIWKWHKN